MPRKKSLSARQKRRADIRGKILTYIKKHSCVDCGESDPRVLQFDHVRGTKKHNISDMLRNDHSWSTILLEIFKCDIVCANCHQIRSCKMQGWYRYSQ